MKTNMIPAEKMDAVEEMKSYFRLALSQQMVDFDEK